MQEGLADLLPETIMIISGFIKNILKKKDDFPGYGIAT